MATTFSYAQAAKGIATPTTTKSAPSAASSVKDAPITSAGPRSWAEDAENETSIAQSTASIDSVPQQASSKPAESAAEEVDVSNVSSPDLGASTSSTVTKDDDVSSLPNTSSESTWDNKSQASTSVEKSTEPAEKTSEKVKKGKNAVVKPLQEAPLPTVNIWKQRADEHKAKVQKAPAPVVNGVAGQKKNETGTYEKSASNDSRQKSREDSTQGKKDVRGESDAKKGKGKFSDKESKTSPSALPLPPTRDQESWPTPDTAIDEDRKKAQEKVEKDRKDSNSTSTHGKQKWVEVPYTPTVVFNTPLPNAANARRGGRGGSRGGAQAGGRSTGSTSNGAEKSEKDASASDAMPNGESNKRLDGPVPSETSPKGKRNGASTSPTFKSQVPAVNGDATKSAPVATDGEAQPRRASFSSQIPSQSSSHPRQYSNRASKGRRGDFNAPGDRRRDGASSPNKDNTLDGRPSAGTQTDFANEGERRTNLQDGPNGHHAKQGRYSSYTGGRERGRGSGRGGRGGFSNNHAFTNGHTPQMSASTFPIGPRSPTTFTPENNAYFSAPQGKYSRGGNRSQSVTQDPFRYPPFQSAPAPIQTYGMYEYNMMQPMSAVPYGSPYVDSYAQVAMITTQVNYYFSVDNLIKDTYLRRHMDSQGFVLLGFIAGFNRIKQLSPDVEMVKLACQQSADVEYRTSEDGQDRLRRKDDWQRWVLEMGERDQSAQHDGPKQLHHPPMPQPAGFDPASSSQWPVMASGMAPIAYGEDGTYPQVNGYHSIPQEAATAEPFVNGITKDASSSTAMTNGHSAETPATQ